jgi:hypothetical protein
MNFIINFKFMKNPKQKLKSILLLVTALFTFSCSKDAYDEINNPNERITIKKLDGRQIKSNKKLSLKLSALNETKTAVIGRFVHDTIYNFVINTNLATHIISNSQETFTFEVLRVNPTPGIENLVLISQPNGTFNATLVKYSFDSNQLLSIDQTAVNKSNVLYTPIDFDYNTVLDSLNSRCTYTINCEETWTESCGIPPSEGNLTGGSIETTCEWVMTTGACYGSCGGNSNSYPEFITLPTTNTSGGNGTNTSQLTPSQIQFFTGLNFNGKDTFNSLSQEVINSIYAYVNTNNTAIQINAVQQFLNNTNGMWLGEQSTQIQQSIFNYLIANGFSIQNKNFINEIMSVLINEPSVDNNALQFMLNAQTFNSINNSELNESFFQNNINLFSPEVQNAAALDPVFLANMAIEYMIQRAVLKHNHPNWSEFDIAWKISGEYVHLSLDAFGLIPVFGEAGDLVNGVLYSIEGDGLNATLSFASAIPFVGWFSAGTKMGLKVIATTTGKTKLIWKMTGGVISFGQRGQLRKVLGLLPGNPAQAHHIIPWNKQSKSIVQRASKSGNAFHMNEALNGIPLSTAVHNGSHANYDNILQIKFDQFNASNPNATPDECYDFLTDLIQDVRNWIASHPDTPINNIVLP